MSDSLWPHRLQHARLPCPSTPGACSNSCPLSQGCHPTISSSVVPFSSCLQSFPASRSFPMSQLFESGGQLQLQHQSFQWIFRTDFLYDWLVWSACSPRDSQESSPTITFLYFCHFHVILSYSFHLLKIPICSCMLSTFSTRSYNTPIIVMSKFYTWAISKFGPYKLFLPWFVPNFEQRMSEELRFAIKTFVLRGNLSYFFLLWVSRKQYLHPFTVYCTHHGKLYIEQAIISFNWSYKWK